MLKSRKYLFVRVKKNGVKRYVLACASANFSKKMTPTQKTQKCSGGGYLLFSSRSELRSNRAYSSVGASTFTPRGGSMLTPRSELRHLLLEGTSVLTPPSVLRHLLLEGTSVLTPPSELQCLFLRRCFGGGVVEGVSFDGLATNNNETWYIRKGKVDSSYTGEYDWKGTLYTVTTGKAEVKKAHLIGEKTSTDLLVFFHVQYKYLFAQVSFFAGVFFRRCTLFAGVRFAGVRFLQAYALYRRMIIYHK